MKKKNIVIVTLVVLATVTIVALMASGRLVWTSGGAGTLAARPVCGNNVVDKFNDAMYMIKREGASTPTIDEAGVKEIEKSIQETEGYEDDATCQTLLFWTAIYHGNYELAKSAYGKVKSLHDKNIFANNNIRGNQPLLSYEQLLDGISPEAKVGSGAL